MAEINSRIRPRIESLEPALRDAILARDVDIRNLHDLIAIMSDIIREEEKRQD